MAKFFNIKIPKGASLGNLAKEYYSSMDAILKLNPEIKDPNVIQAGAFLKIPKLPKEKEPQAYKQAFNTGFEKLFRGEYGKEQAREILLKELEIKYPQIDVATDIYTKIPDDWQIKPTEIPVAAIETEKKKNWFTSITSFVSEKIAQPFRTEVQEAVFDLVEFVNEFPTTKELLKLSGEKVKSTIDTVKVSWKRMEEEIPVVKLPQIGEEPITYDLPRGSDIIKTTLATGVKDYPKLTVSIEDQEKFKKETIEPFIKDIRMKMPAPTLKVASESLLQKPLTEEERLRADPGYALRNLKSLEKDLDKTISNAKLHGVTFLFDEVGNMIGFDEAKTLSEMESLINKKVEEQRISLEKIDPVLSEANRRILENNTLQTKIMGFLNEEMTEIFEYLEKPENLETKKMIKFFKDLQEKFGSPDEFRDLDLALSELEDFNTTEGEFMKTATENQKEFVTLQDELGNLITLPIESFFETQSRLEELSEEEILTLQSFYEVNKTAIDKIISLSAKVQEISDWSKTNTLRLDKLDVRAKDLSSKISDRLTKVISFFQTPEFIEGLTEYSVKTAKPQTELLKALKAFQENRIWYEERETDIKKRTAGLDDNLKSAQQNINAYVEELNQVNVDLFDIIEKVNVAQKNVQSAIYKEEREAYERQKEITDAWMNPWKNRATIWANKKEVAFSAASYMVPEFIGPLIGWAAAGPFGAGVMKVAEKQVFKFFTWLNDDVWRKNLVPQFNAMISEISVGAAQIGFELGTFSMDYLMRDMTAEEKRYWKDDAWLVTMQELQAYWNFPVNELIASESAIERHKKIVNYYRDPKSYEEVIFKRSTSVEDLIPEDRPKGQLIMQIAALNPHIENIFLIPAGTSIRVPRLDPLPAASDVFLPRGVKVDWTLKHPAYLWMFDMFADIVIDPTSAMWGAAMSATAKSLQFVGEVPYKKIAKLADKNTWALKTQNFFDFNSNLIRFISGYSVTEEFAVKVPSLDRLRSNFLRLTVAKSLPYELRKGIKNMESDLAKISPSVKTIEIWDAIDGLPDTSRKIVKQELLDAISDPRKTPTDSSIAFFHKFGMTGLDIWELSKKHPKTKEFLVKIIDAYAVSKDRAKFIAGMFNEKLLTSSDVTKDVFDQLIKSKGGREIAESKVNLRKLYSDRMDDVKKGFNLFSDYEKETELMRFLYKNSEEIVNVPEGVKISEVKKRGLKTLGDEPYKISVVGDKINIVYNPDLYKAGKLPQVIADAIYEPIIKIRLDNLDQSVAYRLKTNYQSTTWEATKPPSKKKYAVVIPGGYEGPIRAVTAEDLLVTSYFDDIKPRIKDQILDYVVREGDTLEKIAKRYYSQTGAITSLNPKVKIKPGSILRIPVILDEILKIKSPDATKEVSFKYSYQRPWEDVIAERAEEGKAAQFAKIEDRKEIVTKYNTVTSYLSRAAALDWLRIDNLDLYVWFKKYINSLDPDALAKSSDLALTKFIFNMDTLRLTDFQRILLLGDDVSAQYKKVISSEIAKLSNSYSTKYNKRLISLQRTKLEGLGLEKWQIDKQVRGIKTSVELRGESIDEISKIKSWTAPNLKKVELKRILPKRRPYLAEIPKQGEAATEALLLKHEEMREGTLKLIREFEIAEGPQILKIQESFTKDLKGMTADLIYLPTKAADSPKISSEQMSEIMAAHARGKIPILYDITKKDKELIKFLTQHDIPYQKLKIPSRVELFSPRELLDELERLNLKAYLSKGVVSDEGILRLLEKSFKWPEQRMIRTRAGRVIPAPLDSIERIYFDSRYESFIKVLKEELNKTQRGRNVLKKIIKPSKVSSHTIEVAADGEIWYRKRPQTEITNIRQNALEDFYKNWVVDYNLATERLGLKSLNLIKEKGKILKLQTNFELQGFNAILQEKALRMIDAKKKIPSTFRGSILPEINTRIMEGRLFKGVSLEAEDFMAKLLNVFDPSAFSNKKAWLKATDTLETLSRLKKEKVILGFDLRTLNSKLKALKARILNIDEIPKLKKRPERKLALNKALKDLPIKKDLIRESGRLATRIKMLSNELDRVTKKLNAAEGTLDDFLSSTGSIKKYPLDIESEFLQIAKNKKAVGLDFIQSIDSRLSTLKKILSRPATIKIMKGVSFESLQREVKRLESLRDIATPWKIAEANKILPTLDEIWDAWKGFRSDALNEKLRKFSEVYAPKKALTGTPLILSEFKDAKFQVPEILIKTKKVNELIKTYLVGDMFVKKLPEIQIVNFDAFKVQETISELKRLEGLGIKIVIDESGLLKSVVSNVPFGFKIVTIEELLPQKLRFVSLEKNSISSPGEIKGMIEMRNMFWDSKKIAIVGLDNRPNLLKDLFYSRYLGDLEKLYLDTAWDDVRRLTKLKPKAYAGPTFIFSRSEQYRDAAKDFKKVLTPVETIEKIYLQVDREIAKHELRKYLENADWILKRVKEVDPFKGGKVLILAQDKTFLERGFRNLLDEGIKREVEFFLPEKMNRGELSAADFLRARNIPFSEIPISSGTVQKLFIGTDEKLPFFLMPSAEFGFKGTRALAFEGFKNRGRIIKTYKGMQEQFAKDYWDQVKRWTTDKNKVMPSILRDEVIAGKRDVVDGLARWFAMIDREKIKDWWQLEKVKLLDNAEYAMRQEIMSVGKRNFLEAWEQRGVKSMVSKWKHTLDGLDQEVFKWNKGQSLLERMRSKLAQDFHYIYLKKADAYGLGPLPIEISKSKRAQLFLMEKAFWDIPEFLKIPRTALQWGRSFWINMVLFWRVGWHIWNSLDDALRESMKARSMKLFFEVQGAYFDATVKFLKDFGGDTAKLMLETTGFYKAAPRLKKETLKLLGWSPESAAYLWKSIDETQKAKYFKAFNLDDYYKAKKTGVLGYLQENLYRRNLREIMSWENASTHLPSGEIMRPDDVRFLASSGISSFLEDPLFVNRRLGYMSEATLFKRIGKRFMVLDADIKLYANTMEELRRLQMAHNLLFEKAMNLSQTEAAVKKWMFDYRDLTAAGQFFRNFFPFYTFNAKAIELYLELCLKQGYRTYIAGKALLRTWSEVTRDLPEHYQNRIEVGNEVYWSPGFSVVQFFLLLTDPIKAVQEFIDNPLRVIGGFGWDPFLASTIENLQGKGYFTLSHHLKENLGWTKWEIDNYLKQQKEKDDLSTSSERIWEFMFQFIPFGPAIKSLTEVDEAMIMREIPLMNSKVIREWLKFFGLNIRKYDDLERLRYVYFDLPPSMRSEWIKELKAENPDLYKIWREYFLIAQLVKIYNTKGEAKLDLLRKYEAKWQIDAFYSLEDNVKGSGYDWLNRNPKAKAYLDLHFRGEQLTEEELKKIQETLGLSKEQLDSVRNDVSLSLTPWRLAAQDEHKKTELKRYISAYLDSIPSGMTQEKIDRLDILGIDSSYTGAFDKQELRNDLFDKHGNLIPLSIEEVNIILKDENWLEKGLEEIGPGVIMKADELFLQWQMLSRKAKEEKKYEDALYYHRLATVFSVLPKDLEDLPEEEQIKYWDEWRKTFDKVLSDEEKVRYASELPEVQKRYLEAMEAYIKTWQTIFSYFEEEDFDFFKIFYNQPQWFRDLYFLKHRNKATWYPFAKEWISMLQVIKDKEEKTGEFLREERKKSSEFFWSKANRTARLAWDKDNPGFLKYMDAWKKIFLETENNPEKYFDMFYNQPQWFQDRFFKANPDKKLYYPFVRQWVKLIDLDKKNWETKAVKTELAKIWFWSKKNKKARDAYAKANMITEDKSIIDYLQAWQDIIEITEENPDKYFEEFYSQPDWFTKHFFKTNPNKAVYYPFVQKWTGLIKEDQEIFKKTGTRSTKAAEYFWKDTKEARIARQLYEKDNPGILNYLKTWEKIIEQTENNPETYFDLFYQQSEEFQNRFFENNPDKEIYYPHLREWVRLIALDKKNWDEKRIRTVLASQWFWRKNAAKARELYAKNNMITETKSILDYLKGWELVMKETEERPKEFFEVFDKQPQWFEDHYFANHPERRIYYPFAKELGKQKAEDFASFFWAAKYEKERQAWEKDKPGFLAYMGFWKELSKYAEIGNWEQYFKSYYSSENKVYRERHWRNDPRTKESFALFRDYTLMPSMTWEDRKAKRVFLKKNPKLLEWWAKDLSEGEAELREKVEHYFALLDNIKADGTGRSYYLDYREWKVAADRYLKMNPDVLLFLEKKPKHYTGEKAIIFALISDYETLTFPEEKRIYFKNHPELANYFLNTNPPGIRTILKLQTEYFTLADKEKTTFLDAHPELKDWWDVTKLPWSYFFAPDRFRPFENAVTKVDKAFALYRSRNWKAGETLRLALPNLYTDPGTSEEDDWFKNKVYKLAMETWIKLIDQNEFMAVYFFRQLPRWLRDQYYTKHPEKRYLSTEPLSRFLEEPLRVWSSLNPELSWAFYQHYKYGRNMPFKIEKKVRETFLKYGIWRARSNWTQSDWNDYWVRRSLKLNEIRQFDLDNLPLLRAEFNKVIRTFPLRLAPKVFGKPRIGVIEPFF